MVNFSMVKLTPEEKRRLFHDGYIDNRGNVRLDSLDKVQEIIKMKEEKVKQSFDKIRIAKASQQLLGVRIGECRVIAIFGEDAYLNCFGKIKPVTLEFIISYIKGVRYVER